MPLSVLNYINNFALFYVSEYAENITSIDQIVSFL